MFKSQEKSLFPNLSRRLTLVRAAHFTPEFKLLALRVFVAFVIISIVVTFEGLALWILSRDENPLLSTPGDGIYYIVVSVFGETTAPASKGARIITLIALSQGLLLATYLVAVAAFFTIRGGRVMTRKHKQHFVICGWNFQAPRILEELLGASGGKNFDIVVVPGKEIPEQLSRFGSKVFVIQGSPTEDRILAEADIYEARSVIILSDTTVDANTSDAHALMITLAVETMNPSAYTCVQVMNSENEIHLARAHVDETIPFDVLGANLSVASALNPGITKVINELVHFDEGSEIYKLYPPIPSNLIGKTFKEAAVWFIDRDMILVGVESKDLVDSYKTLSGEMPNPKLKASKASGLSVNPKGHQIKEDDALFLISDEDPAVLLA